MSGSNLQFHPDNSPLGRGVGGSLCLTAAVGRAGSWGVPSVFGSGYLGVIVVGAVLTQVVAMVLPQWRLAGGVPALALIVAAYAGFAGLLWLREPWQAARGRALRAFLIAFVALWAYATLLTVVRREPVAMAGVIVPALLVMVLLKLPDGTQARRATEVLAWSLVAASALTLALEMTDVIRDWYELDYTRSPAVDRESYWLPLADPLGIHGRWAGPWGHPNQAGVVGAFLVVFGITCSGVRRVVFMVAGALVLVLAESRTSMIATVVGVIVVAAAWWVTRPGRLGKRARLALLAVPLVAIAIVVAIVNSNLTGRTSMWPQAVRLWAQSPVLGVGQTGFDDAIRSGDLYPWAIQAHNVWLDAGVRLGVVGLALALIVTVAAVLVVVAGARRGDVTGLALVAMLLTGGLTDVNVDWTYLAMPTVVLVLAVLTAQPARPDRQPHLREWGDVGVASADPTPTSPHSAK